MVTTVSVVLAFRISFAIRRWSEICWTSKTGLLFQWLRLVKRVEPVHVMRHDQSPMTNQVARNRARKPLGAMDDRGWIDLDGCHFAFAHLRMVRSIIVVAQLANGISRCGNSDGLHEDHSSDCGANALD